MVHRVLLNRVKSDEAALLRSGKMSGWADGRVGGWAGGEGDAELSNSTAISLTFLIVV
jgi:hypothetical protein